jgi:bifunctional DNA-binding transcriptional regulator/antitoxin component of YhaV-PrlF toxin-antitoxin module
MSATVKLTSKRQATFPAELCEEMGLIPGDELELIPRAEGGERYWILQKRKSPDRPWFGSLKAYAGNVEDHSIEAMRESIRAGRKAQ